jgi:SAM-dependent methyltransferase
MKKIKKTINRSDYYSEKYRNIHYKGILGKFTVGYHKKIEHGMKDKFYSKVLEIGAGNGEHFRHVHHGFNKYFMTDLTIPKPNFVLPSSVVVESQNVELLSYPDATFDRCIGTCVLHHVNFPEKALNEIRRVTMDGGLITLYIPCDPGFLYRAIRHPTSHLKTAITMQSSMREVKYLWATEHRNNVLMLLSLIKQIYQRDLVKIYRFPFPFFSWNFNIYFVVRITVNHSDN